MQGLKLKTLEFKLDLTLEQQHLIDNWRSRLRHVWNIGLSLLEEKQQRFWREKSELEDNGNEKWDYYRNPDRWDAFQDEGQKSAFAGEVYPACRTTRYDRAHDAVFQCCEIREHRNIDVAKRFYSGQYYSAEFLPSLADVPSKYKTGVHKALLKSWEAYQSKTNPAKRPKYKSQKDKIDSLVNYNAGGQSNELKPHQTSSNNGRVNFPGLGKLKVIDLFERFKFSQTVVLDTNGAPKLNKAKKVVKTVDYGVCRIICEPSGYYLHILTNQSRKPLHDSCKAVGIDPGVTDAIALDNGRAYRPNQKLKQWAKRQKRLQRKLSRQKLKSKNWQKTQKQISLLHERTRRSRKAFNHQLSTKLVQEFGFIAIEDTKLQNMTRKPKPKLKQDGSGYEKNGAAAKAGLNRSLLNIAIGQFRRLLENKVDVSDNRFFEKTKAPYSSQECHACKEKGDRKSKVFRCLNPLCQQHDKQQDADVNASRNHLLNSSFLTLDVVRKPFWYNSQIPLMVGQPSYAGLAAEVKPDSIGDAPIGEHTMYALKQEVDRNDTQASNPAIPENLNPVRGYEGVKAQNRALISPSKKRKRRSAQTNPENLTQISLWDLLAETG